MTTIRERVDFAELVLKDLQAQASKAEKATKRAWRGYISACRTLDAKSALRWNKERDVALKTEYSLREQCLELEAELVELQRVLATGTDPHPAIQEGTL